MIVIVAIEVVVAVTVARLDIMMKRKMMVINQVTKHLGRVRHVQTGRGNMMMTGPVTSHLDRRVR